MAYTPGGNDLVNTLQNEDVLTGNTLAGATSLTGTLGNANDQGYNVVAPSMTNVQTVNIAFTNTFTGFTLDFQDITGTTTANMTRISNNFRDSFTNLSVETVNLGVANTSEQAKATFSFLNNELASASNAVTLTLNNASLSNTQAEFDGAGAALKIQATDARGSDLQHEIETYNVVTAGTVGSSVATFATGVSSYNDLVVGQRPVTINVATGATASLAVGTLRWLGNRVETNSANAFQIPTLHQVGTNGLGFVDYSQIKTINVTGASNVTLANVGTWIDLSQTNSAIDFTLNAATATGSITADISNAAGSLNSSFIGGLGSDRFYASGSVAALVSGGALEDSLTVQSNSGATVNLFTGSTAMEDLNLVQGIATAGEGAAWSVDLADGGFTAVTFNNQDAGAALNATLTNFNAATTTLSVRSTGLNVNGDPDVTAQGAVNIGFTQGAAVVGGTVNLELGHASDDRANNDAFSYKNYTSNVSIIDNAASGATNAATGLNLVVNTAGVAGTGQVNLTVNNGDFETSTTLSSNQSATNIVNIGFQQTGTSSDYTAAGTNGLNSTTYNGSAYLGQQNVTFGSVNTGAATNESFNITTGSANGNTVDLSFMGTSAARTASGFALSSYLLNTEVDLGTGTGNELILSATLADPRVVITPDATYDGYFQNWTNVDTLTINNRNGINAATVGVDAYAQTNNAGLNTINFNDVSGTFVNGFRFTNDVTISVDATGDTELNQQLLKTTTINSYASVEADLTLNVDASNGIGAAGNYVAFTSTGAALGNAVTLNYTNLSNAGATITNTQLSVAAGSLDVVHFQGNLGLTAGGSAASGGALSVITNNGWTASGQTTSYDFSIVSSLGLLAGGQATITFNASAENNSPGLTIAGSTDGNSATQGVNNTITGSNGTFANGFGNDTITSGGFVDTLNGLGGNDNITWTNATAALATGVTITGDQGNDTLIANATSVNAVISIDGGIDNDTITVSGAGTTTLTGGLGLDTITGGSGIDTITAGENADTVNITRGAVDTIVQGADDSNRAVTTDFGAGTLITAGDTMTFSNGVDVVTGFTAGAGGDVVRGDVSVSQSILGQDASAITTSGWLSGNYDPTTGRFTVTANGDGRDTAFIQRSGTGGTNLVAGTGAAVNQSIVILQGVNTAALINSNFSGLNVTTLTAQYAGTTFSFTGTPPAPFATQVVTVAADGTVSAEAGANITQAAPPLNPVTVTVFNFSALTGGFGVNASINTLVSTALTSVLGTSWNDNITLSETTLLNSATLTVNGGTGTDTLTLTNMRAGATTIVAANLVSIENVSLTNGTVDAGGVLRTLTFSGAVTAAVANASATVNATVVLGSSAAQTYSSLSSGIDDVTLGVAGQSVSTGTGADIVRATAATALAGGVGSTIDMGGSLGDQLILEAGTYNLAAAASATTTGYSGVETIVTGTTVATASTALTAALTGALAVTLGADTAAGANTTTVTFTGAGNTATVDAVNLEDGVTLTVGASSANVAINNLIADLTVGASTGSTTATLAGTGGVDNTVIGSAANITVANGTFATSDLITVSGAGNYTVTGLVANYTSTATGSSAITTGATALTLTNTSGGVFTVNAGLMADSVALTLGAGTGAYVINNLSDSDTGALSASTGGAIITGTSTVATQTVNGTAGIDSITIVATGAGTVTVNTGALADTISLIGSATTFAVTGGTGADRITVGTGTATSTFATGDTGANVVSGAFVGTSGFDVYSGFGVGDTLTATGSIVTGGVVASTTSVAGVDNAIVFTRGDYSAGGNLFTASATGADSLVTFDFSAGATTDFQSAVLIGFVGTSSTAGVLA
jgi:hypothetical protein